jgi:hypothetical protein
VTALRDKLIIQHGAGRASDAQCYRYALEAGRQAEYYRSRGIDISGDPAAIAVQLHPDIDGSAILHAFTYAGKIVYDIRVGSGMLSGSECRLTMLMRNGLYVPIADEVIVVY